ncbi:ATP/GTP-binding protein [Chitinophaga sp.]|uniref:ATP/GTP-binding protein n=1 Tax=Chitinophaga sp. TaxID=1869181 RepID=UPI0031DF48F4
MKTIFIAIAIIFTHVSLFAQHSLEKLWQTDTVLTTPESALLAANGQFLYVSNIGSAQKERSGYISKVAPGGKIITREWVTGLNAPKGLGLYKGLLYAAELTAVAVIDVKTGTIVRRIPIEGAQMLNDITIDAKGVVYVSDSKANKIHKIENGRPSLYLENMDNANGLLAVGPALYALTNGKLLKIDAQKNPTIIAEGLEGRTDGLVQVRENEFIVSGWQGIIYYVKADGTKQVLLDTRDQKSNTADIGYNAVAQTLYVPTFFKNTIVAYRLK